MNFFKRLFGIGNKKEEIKSDDFHKLVWNSTKPSSPSEKVKSRVKGIPKVKAVLDKAKTMDSLAKTEFLKQIIVKADYIGKDQSRLILATIDSLREQETSKDGIMSFLEGVLPSLSLHSEYTFKVILELVALKPKKERSIYFQGKVDDFILDFQNRGLSPNRYSTLEIGKGYRYLKEDKMETLLLRIVETCPNGFNKNYRRTMRWTYDALSSHYYLEGEDTTLNQDSKYVLYLSLFFAYSVAYEIDGNAMGFFFNKSRRGLLKENLTDNEYLDFLLKKYKKESKFKVFLSELIKFSYKGLPALMGYPEEFYKNEVSYNRERNKVGFIQKVFAVENTCNANEMPIMIPNPFNKIEDEQVLDEIQKEKPFTASKEIYTSVEGLVNDLFL